MCKSALGFELWSVSDDILFDNIIVTDDKRVAEDWAEQTWVIKHEQELAGTASAVSHSLSLLHHSRLSVVCSMYLMCLITSLDSKLLLALISCFRFMHCFLTEELAVRNFLG